MGKRIAVLAVAGALAFGMAGQATAASTKALLFYKGEVIRTVAVTAPIPHQGRDPLYNVTNGVDGQLGITAVAPGDAGYHGGQWAVYLVTFNEGVTPYLLTSQQAVLDAEAAGDVTVTRAPELDNRCPVQP